MKIFTSRSIWCLWYYELLAKVQARIEDRKVPYLFMYPIPKILGKRMYKSRLTFSMEKEELGGEDKGVLDGGNDVTN